MTPQILSNFLPLDISQRALESVYSLTLQSYNNPFEKKGFLEDKSILYNGYFPNLSYAFNELRSSEMCKWVSRILGVPILYADFQHYGGLFVYKEGDFLSPHVDAGLHPVTELRKVATVLLYLTPATLSTWRGDPCTDKCPTVWLEHPYHLVPNTCVLFTNDNVAWHSVPVIHGPDIRCVLTVSYLAPPEFSNSYFTNTRTRAYFAPVYGKPDKLQHLREQRASESEHSKVYRTKGETA